MFSEQITPEKKLTHPLSSGNIRSIGLILVSVLFGAAGQLTFKAALNEIGELTFSAAMLFDLATSPLMICGLLIFGLSAFLWLIALMKADLSFAYPFLSLSYITVMLGGAFLFGEQIYATRVIGIFVIITGLLVIAQGEKQNSQIQ